MKVNLALVFFGLLAGFISPAFEALPGANNFPPEANPFLWNHISLGPWPIRFPQHLFSVHDHGRQRSDRGPQHFFCFYVALTVCSLGRFRAEEHDRPVTKSIATPEPSSKTIPTLDRTLVARWSLECVTTLGSCRFCPGWAAAHFTWIFTVFPTLHVTSTHFQDRWGLSFPHHVAATDPFGAAWLSLFHDSLEVLSRVPDGITKEW